MVEMADPMIALRLLQKALDADQVDLRGLDGGYLKMEDAVPSGERYSYAKIVDGVAQAVSIFGLDDPIDGVECFSVGYAVNENHRRRGLAVEAVNTGIEDLKKRFLQTKLKRFYVEAVIEVKNISSIKVAKKLFSEPGIPCIETYSGKRSLQFKKLIN